MPAINVNMYVRIPQPVVPLWNTANDISTAQVIPTDPKSGVARNTVLQGTVYYVNENNVAIGYVYVPSAYSIDINSMQVYSNSAWTQWNNSLDENNNPAYFRNTGSVANLNGENYDVYECSWYDPGEETYVPINSYFCFNLEVAR